MSTRWSAPAIELLDAGTVSGDRHAKWLPVFQWALIVSLSALLLGLLATDFNANFSRVPSLPVDRPAAISGETAAGLIFGVIGEAF